MDERAALRLLADELPFVGDDAAVVDGHVLTTDMLHASTDFPEGTSMYTAGWRAVGASLSDIAAMGARPIAAVAAYGVPTFDAEEIRSFVRGASDVCDHVGAAYVGGDLDNHQEFTVASTVLGTTDEPIYRDGATVGDRICVTGSLGRSAVALDRFDAEKLDEANELFRFEPRIEVGLAVSNHGASAMIDSSDGLARSIHQIATASGVGMKIRSEAIPVDHRVIDTGCESALERAIGFGEDFELVFTASQSVVDSITADVETPVSDIGSVIENDATMLLDDDPLPDTGYTH